MTYFDKFTIKVYLSKDPIFPVFKANFQLQQHEKETATRTLRAQITTLHDRLKLVGDTEVGK